MVFSVVLYGHLLAEWWDVAWAKVAGSDGRGEYGRVPTSELEDPPENPPEVKSPGGYETELDEDNDINNEGDVEKK